ncbi:lipoprotein NlpI [Aestuariibacter salexigens]|uniref:lipoprotein NlpI n=1 Tax=Aestuariibacter salexigens TaxID=226010 RepID=UPI000479E7B3|nr:lipoprotein NlpI [Aestuariibacter salexigens]
MDSLNTVSRICLLLFLSCLLGACTSSQRATESASQMGNLLLAEPVPMSPRSQLAIARYNHILAQAPLSNEERAELIYQRGMLYDSVGLSALAQFDFDQAIKLKPDMAEAYNSLGIHYTQQMEFILAYEAFDSSLDINPDYEFAFLNRGIALYYGGRPDLAINDFSEFKQLDERDPYRVIWQYIAQREVNEADALIALADSRRDLDPNNWAISLVDLYLGKITENQLLNSLLEGVSNQRQLTDRLCEAYFYLGKYNSALGHQGIAANYFKLAISTNVFEFVEHRYARLELDLLREEAREQKRVQ